MTRFFIAIVFLFAIATSACAQCNPPSGWVTQYGPIVVGNAIMYGPNCGQMQDSGFSISGANSPIYYADITCLNCDNTNNGTSPATPFQTVTHAWIVANSGPFLTGRSGTIQLLCNAPQTEGVIFGGDGGEAARLSFLLGNVSSPSSCMMNAQTGPPQLFTDFAVVVVNGVGFENGEAANIAINQHSTVDFENSYLGSCAVLGDINLDIEYDGVFNLDGPITWNPGSSCENLAFVHEAGAQFNLNGETITCQGTIVVQAIFEIFNVGNAVGPWTFSGCTSFTGKQYDVERNGNLYAAGSSYPAGASAGTTSTGGQAN